MLQEFDTFCDFKKSRSGEKCTCGMAMTGTKTLVHIFKKEKPLFRDFFIVGLFTV